MRRRSLLSLFDAFLAMLLFAMLIGAVSVERDFFSNRLALLSRAEILDDILSTWQAEGRMGELVKPGYLETYSRDLRAAEVASGARLCLFLDGTPLYRTGCSSTICSERFFAQASVLGIVDFRRARLCLDGPLDGPLEGSG